MNSIINPFAQQLKAKSITWTEFMNILLDFDIEIVEIRPALLTNRADKQRTCLMVTFSDKASEDKIELEF